MQLEQPVESDADPDADAHRTGGDDRHHERSVGRRHSVDA
jgi:hypothetical protein